MKKLLLSLSVIIVFLVYSWHQKNEADQVVVTPPNLSPTQQVTQIPVTPLPTTSGSTPPPTAVPATPTTKPRGQYKDGSYTGSVEDAIYGNIQVQAVISGGKLTDVVFLQYPNDRNTSVEINTQAMPYLKQEAIAAQNANVDIISGATDSSIAFRQSLGTALSQAKI